MATRDELTEEIARKRKQQILKAAFTVISRKGYGSAKAADIAKEASVSVGTIYKYFKNKHSLFLAVIDRYLLSQQLKNLMTQALETDYPDFLQNVIKERLGHKQKEVLKFFSIMSEVIRHPRLHKKYTDEILHPIFERMEGYVDFKVRTGQFKDIDKRIVTRAVGCMMVGLMILYAAEGEKSPLKKIAKDKIAQDITTILTKGILAEDI